MISFCLLLHSFHHFVLCAFIKAPIWLLGIQESDGTPEHVQERIHEWIDDKEFPEACISPQKMWTFKISYTCPSAPFYRGVKGLLHSEHTLRSTEYSKWEHVHKHHFWLQTFTSLPIIHTLNPDFQCHAFDPASSWLFICSRDSPRVWI
jgi:hypothetical protein